MMTIVSWRMTKMMKRVMREKRVMKKKRVMKAKTRAMTMIMVKNLRMRWVDIRMVWD